MNIFEILVRFSHKRNHHIQDEALHNGRMLERTFLLVCPLHWFRNFPLNMVK